MRNLVSSTSHRVIAEVGEENYNAYCGVLCSPLNRYYPKAGVVWAADNGAYSYWARSIDYDSRAFVQMLERYRGLSGCLFVVAPDVVGDAEGTLLLFRAWVGTIRRYGFPVAFVLQNGASSIRIPWDSFDALFIGGDTKFKLSQETEAFAKEAKRRGKHVHMGRVNSRKRIQRAHEMGCDSFDGTGYALNTRYVREHLTAQTHIQRRLWEDVC